MHVHSYCPDGEAKFWIEPVVALADYSGLSQWQLRELAKVACRTITRSALVTKVMVKEYR